MPRIAVIDIGTNSVLFLGVEIAGETWRPLASDASTIRLGRGLSGHGRIETDRIQALVDCIQDLKNRARSLDADRIVAFGTHVFRAAQNRDEVIDAVRRKTDIRIEVLSEKDEAEWSFQGMIWGRGLDGPVLTADIGGGSTELLSGSSSGVRAFVSLPLGAVILTERFLHHDPPLDDEFRNMQRDIADTLGSVSSKLRIEGERLLASGGTATTLAALELEMAEYDPDRVDGFILSKKRLESWIEKFRSLPLESRKELKGLEPKRADIILGGATILLAVMSWAGFEEVTICDRGLRHGIVLRELARMQPA